MGKDAETLTVARPTGDEGLGGREAPVNGAPTGRGHWWQRLHALPIGRIVAVGGSLALAAWCGCAPVQAQSNQRPAIVVAPVISAEPASQMPFPVSVGPAGAVPRNAFVRMRGLPPMAALSEAHTIAPGAWAVALTAIPDLRITLPVGASGRSEITITLVAVDGTVLAEAKSTLAIGPAPTERAQASRNAGPPAAASILRAGVPLQPPPAESLAPKATPDPLTPQDRERAVRMLRKGDAHLEEGNVSAARLLYERAAESGLAEAAMALAATYDTSQLTRLKLRGIEANAKEASRWYERARQLGAVGAEERLRQIGAR
jgi:hypothetical protein